MIASLPVFLKDTDGQIEFVGTRLTISDVLNLYNQGYSAEMIVLEYPFLALAIVHHFIAYYLDNTSELDKYFANHRARAETRRDASLNQLDVAALRRRITHPASA